MASHSHPTEDSSDRDDPDFCPFCGAAVADGGGGFVDHLADSAPCRARFEAWRSRIRDDVEGAWIG